MINQTLGRQRLRRQGIAHPLGSTAGEVVSSLGAVQAQDYLGALWAVGLRLAHATEATIEQAIMERTIVRTWPMRGTLHFVGAADVRWMLELLTPRVRTRNASRLRQLELNEAVLDHSRQVIRTVLAGGMQLARPALYAELEAAGIATTGQRGVHVLGQLAQEGLICFGPRSGTQPSFVLLEEWLPPTPKLEREAALAELVRRYFTSHGPATVQDCMWWSGLTGGDVRAGLDLAHNELYHERINDQSYWFGPTLPDPEPAPDVFLLPGFDEFVLGYTDRSAIIEPAFKEHLSPGSNGMFSSTIVINGQLRGTWKRVLKKDSVVISFQPFTPLSDAEQAGCVRAAEQYGTFLERSVRFA